MILSVGDSVLWGQGLEENHKFDRILATQKNLPLVRLAHSGAVIGTRMDRSNETEAGEVPVSWPSIWQQALAQGNWSQVDLVLLNGGINDVGLTRILNPVTSASQLAGWIEQFCYLAMQELLTFLVNAVRTANTTIAVLGYYPILSDQSGATDEQFQSLLEVHGVSTQSVLAPDRISMSSIMPKIVENCLQFWKSSTGALQSAVMNTNKTAGANICRYVELPLTETNAMWAPQSLLWELNPILLPEDEVAVSRCDACKELYGDIVHLPQWIQCDRASAGHPSIAGSARIADALIAAFGN